MEKLMPATLLVSLLLGACPGDDDGVVCPAILKAAVIVHVSSPDGLPVDAVEATREHERACDPELIGDAGGFGDYRCWDDGGGEYTVRVMSGEKTWTKTVTVAAGACGTTEVKELSFVLRADGSVDSGVEDGDEDAGT